MLKNLIFSILLFALPLVPIQADGQADIQAGVQAGEGYKLEPAAFSFIGLPFVEPREVTIFIIDGWGDAHGRLVESIILTGAPGARIITRDIDALPCDPEPFSLYILCVQNHIANFVEEAASLDGLVVVNMSLSLFYFDRYYIRFLDPDGCENSPRVNLESLKRIAKAIEGSRKGIVWVASAGNQGIEFLGFPACLSRVYAAAALKREREYDPLNLRLAFYSNREGTALALPLGGVLVVDGYEFEGTSFAAPVLTALFANWISLCKDEPQEINPQWRTVNSNLKVPNIFSAKCRG